MAARETVTARDRDAPLAAVTTSRSAPTSSNLLFDSVATQVASPTAQVSDHHAMIEVERQQLARRRETTPSLLFSKQQPYGDSCGPPALAGQQQSVSPSMTLVHDAAGIDLHSLRFDSNKNTSRQQQLHSGVTPGDARAAAPTQRSDAAWPRQPVPTAAETALHSGNPLMYHQVVGVSAAAAQPAASSGSAAVATVGDGSSGNKAVMLQSWVGGSGVGDGMVLPSDGSPSSMGQSPLYFMGSDEVQLLAPLITLKLHWDALQSALDRNGGDTLFHSSGGTRLSSSAVLLRSSIAVAFHHMESVLLNSVLVTVCDDTFLALLHRATDLWRKGDPDSVLQLSDTISLIDSIIQTRKATAHLSTSAPLARLTGMSTIWFLVTSRETNSSLRIVVLGLIALMQIVLLIINVATGQSLAQVVISVLLLLMNMTVMFMMSMLIQHVSILSLTDVLRPILCPDVEWLQPEDFLSHNSNHHNKMFSAGSSSSASHNSSAAVTPTATTTSNNGAVHQVVKYFPLVTAALLSPFRRTLFCVAESSSRHILNSLEQLYHSNCPPAVKMDGSYLRSIPAGMYLIGTPVVRLRPCIIISSNTNTTVMHRLSGGVGDGNSSAAAPKHVGPSSSAVAARAVSPGHDAHHHSAAHRTRSLPQPQSSSSYHNPFSSANRDDSQSAFGFVARIEGDSLRGSVASLRHGSVNNAHGASGNRPVSPTAAAAGGGGNAAHAAFVTIPLMDMIKGRRMMLQCDTDVIAFFTPLLIVDRDTSEIVTVTKSALDQLAMKDSQLIGAKMSQHFVCEVLGPTKSHTNCRPVALRFARSKMVVHATQCLARKVVSGGAAPSAAQLHRHSSAAAAGSSVAYPVGFYGGALHSERGSVTGDGDRLAAATSGLSWVQTVDAFTFDPLQLNAVPNNSSGNYQMAPPRYGGASASHLGPNANNPAGASGASVPAVSGHNTAAAAREQRTFLVYLLGAVEKSSDMTSAASGGGRRSATENVSLTEVIGGYSASSAPRIHNPFVSSAASTALGLAPSSLPPPALSLLASRSSPKTHGLSSNSQQQQQLAEAAGASRDLIRRSIALVLPSAEVRFASAFPAVAVELLPMSTLMNVCRRIAAHNADDASAAANAMVCYFDTEPVILASAPSTTSDATTSSRQSSSTTVVQAPGAASVKSGLDGSGDGGMVAFSLASDASLRTGAVATGSSSAVMSAPHMTTLGSVRSEQQQELQPHNSTSTTCNIASSLVGSGGTQNDSSTPIPSSSPLPSAPLASTTIVVRIAPSRAFGSRPIVTQKLHEELKHCIESVGGRFTFSERTQSVTIRFSGVYSPPASDTTVPSASAQHHPLAEGGGSHTAARDISPKSGRRLLGLPAVLSAASGGFNDMLFSEMSAATKDSVQVGKQATTLNPWRRSLTQSGVFDSGSQMAPYYQAAGAAACTVRVLVYTCAGVVPPVEHDAVAADLKALQCLFDAGALVQRVVDFGSLCQRLESEMEHASASQLPGAHAVTSSSFDILLCEWDEAHFSASTDAGRYVLEYLLDYANQPHATFLFSRPGAPQPPPQHFSGSVVMSTSWSAGSDVFEQFLPAMVTAMVNIKTSQQRGRGADWLPSPRGAEPPREGAYTLGRRLGSGSFGDVFEVKLEISGGTLAMKRIFISGSDTEAHLLDEVRREVQLLATLQHKNIVRMSHCTREDRFVCIFMELCENSLAQLLRERTSSPPGAQQGGAVGGEQHMYLLAPQATSNGFAMSSMQLVHIINDVVSGLQYLHAQGIAHRDLKPENILFRHGVAKISDFGTAARDREATPLINMKGTLAYMAPEVVVGEPYGRPVDMWAMGCILAEMLGVPLLHLYHVTMPHLTRLYETMGMSDSLDVAAVPVDLQQPKPQTTAPPESNGNTTTGVSVGDDRSHVPRSGSPRSARNSRPRSPADDLGFTAAFGPHDDLVSFDMDGRPDVANVPPSAAQLPSGAFGGGAVPPRLSLPSEVEHLLRRCFTRDPAKRITADELLSHPVCYDEVWLAQMRIGVADKMPKIFIGGGGALVGTVAQGNLAHLAQFPSMDMSLVSCE